MKKPLASRTPRASPRPTSRKPATIDAYLATVRVDRRSALERLRAIIHAAVPDAVECISYGMPAFRVGARVVAGFQATSSGCSYYPFSGSTLDTLRDALAGFGRTKSALHFDADRSLSPALVKKLLRARLAELPRTPARPGKGPRPVRT
jgi:uncharacterized protein YdhG (YjbR/CyaY superfamily)